MKFNNFKIIFKSVLALYFLFVPNIVHSSERNNAQNVVADNSDLDNNSSSFIEAKIDHFVKDFINASENKPNTTNTLCNNLLFTGIPSGKKLIQDRIKEVALSIPESKRVFYEIDAFEVYTDNYVLGPQYFENIFRFYFDIAMKEKKVIILSFENMEFIIKDISKYKYNAETKQYFEDALRHLLIGLDLIRKNPYIFLVGFADYNISTEANLLNYFNGDIIDLGNSEMILLKRKFDDLNQKPKLMEVNVILDSLDDPRFEVENKQRPVNERYVKTDLKGITGWVPFYVYEIIEKMQITNCDNGVRLPNVDGLQNRFLFYGPQGNGKTALIKKIAQVTDSHLIEINGTDLFTGYVNHAAEKF
jgi:hypothetical protein